MSTPERPAKRARQACDPCRRKKSRCPGERPVCSQCARLRQHCTYTDESLAPRSINPDAGSFTTPIRPTTAASENQDQQGGADTARRLHSLETQLAEVLNALQGQRGPASQDSPSATRTSSNEPVPPDPAPTQSLGLLNNIEDVAKLYLRFCHNQPLPLFAPASFTTNLHERGEEVVFAVLAIALRFSQSPPRDQIQLYTKKSKSLVLHRISEGPIELSTLQSLCILSWLEFYNSNSHSASMFISLASDICNSSDLAHQGVADPRLHDERIRCFWSITLLRRLHPNSSSPAHLAFDEDGMIAYPESPARPAFYNGSLENAPEPRAIEHRDLGIVAYAIQLTEVWYKVSRYAHRRASAGPYPPWSPKSDYARIIAHQMDSETNMPYSKHRFKPVRFEERSSEELNQHRDYWGPWLFTQVLYHTIICVLNHPLLLSLRLRHFRVASVPEIWLQQSDDLISQHSQWIVNLIDLVQEKAFMISDPFLAHCVAIVATIYLQQSFGDDRNVQQIKKDNFAKCHSFCERVGQEWSSVKFLAQKLQRFEGIVSESYLNSAASSATGKVFIDLNLFWEILESASISDKPDKNGLFLGSSLRTRTRSSIVAEELNARLLPEPSRVAVAGSPVNGAISQRTPAAPANSIHGPLDQLSQSSNDFNVLAQSYFAQGQDFVGNMDDWWLLDDSMNLG